MGTYGQLSEISQNRCLWRLFNSLDANIGILHYNGGGVNGNRPLVRGASHLISLVNTRTNDLNSAHSSPISAPFTLRSHALDSSLGIGLHLCAVPQLGDTASRGPSTRRTATWLAGLKDGTADKSLHELTARGLVDRNRVKLRNKYFLFPPLLPLRW